MLRIPIPSFDLLRQPEQEIRGVDEVFYALNEGLSADESRHGGREIYVVLTSSGWRFGGSAKNCCSLFTSGTFSGAGAVGGCLQGSSIALP